MSRFACEKVFGKATEMEQRTMTAPLIVFNAFPLGISQSENA